MAAVNKSRGKSSKFSLTIRTMSGRDRYLRGSIPIKSGSNAMLPGPISPRPAPRSPCRKQRPKKLILLLRDRQSSSQAVQFSEATYDAARTAAAVAKAQLEVTTAKIEQMEAVLRQVEVDLYNTDIRSPVDGVIIQRSVELGQTVAASLQSPTIFTIADDLRSMEIVASVDETGVCGLARSRA